MSELQLGNEMAIKVVKVSELQEADINAHVMPPAKFQRLVDNIRKRGSLESLPYVHQPFGSGTMRIVSGHHRVRAARSAGLTEIPVIVDTKNLSPSEVTAAQIAHNVLVGFDDDSMLKELLKQISEVDALLATGLPREMLPISEGESPALYAPHTDFVWKYVTLVFLTHQFENFKGLVDRLATSQDMTGVVSADLFQSFLTAASRYGRLKDIRSLGTVVAVLTEIANRESESIEAENASTETESGPSNGKRSSTVKTPAKARN